MASEEFRSQVKDALDHLYDSAHLQVHPLMRWVSDPAGADQVSRAQRLRGLLKDGIEALRPQLSAENKPPEWRPYRALTHRYVRGMSMDQASEELGISVRQLQRELHKGLDALADLLAERHGETGEAQQTKDRGQMPELVEELRQWQLTWTVMPAKALLDETLSLLSPMLSEMSVAVHVDVPQDLPPVLVDATLMRQALYKLIRLLAVGSGCGVSARAEERTDAIIVILSCATCRPNVMAEGWQLAQLLVHEQGGRLALEPGTDAGARVLLTLPRARRARVLVVDDNQAIHQLFERYLAAHHYEVLHALTGVEALRMAEETAPDLITLDVMMPGMDGWQVLRQFGENPVTSKIPILICSVLRDPELAYALGARAYLKKPVDRLDLLAALARLQGDARDPGAGYPTAPADTATSP